MSPQTFGRRPTFTEGNFELDEACLKSLPVPGTEVISAHAYGQWLWARQARVLCRLPDGGLVTYFLKVTSGECDRQMIEGQFESDKAIHEVLPFFCPEPLAWGKYTSTPGPDQYFLLAQFREVGQRPPEPLQFAAWLADLHKRSVSPTGKFGFHTTTCHSKSPQLTDIWEESWEVLYRKQLAHVLEQGRQKLPPWDEYEFYAGLVLDKCVGRLLGPLQSDGRSIKPCLVHGNLWDGNTGTDMETGKPFVFGGSAFYAHNEYELGQWRTPRHRLSGRTYVRTYKRHFPASEPEEDWDSRNLLYSLRFNVTAAYLIPGGTYRRE
ncbi:uncharacterized protein PG998_012737 [Apiospora kogelbergensis]|uniref:uncharacterized protein n=1 Tax=Apiospora kogelbergensis TaxID=1337665 RepID=UPI00312D2999